MGAVPQHALSRPLRALAVVAMAFGVACRWEPPRPVSPAQLLFIAPNGRGMQALEFAEAVRRGEPVGSEYDDSAFSRHLKRVLETVRSSSFDTIVVFVHGGLVDYQGGYDHAAELDSQWRARGYLPLFVNWKAGPLSTMGSHLFRIRNGEDHGPVLGALTSPLIVAEDAGRMLTHAPHNWLNQVGDWCRFLSRQTAGDPNALVNYCAIPGLGRFAARAKQADSLALAIAAAPAPDALSIRINSYNPSDGQSVTKTVVGALTLLPRLVTGPIITGFGEGPFAEMRRRTQTMFRRPDELEARPASERGYRPSEGAAAQLVAGLARVLADSQPESCDPGAAKRCRSVILVGHSMGAIVLNRVLVEHPELPVSRVYYLAAAASVNDVVGAVVPFMERPAHHSTRVYFGLLHPYAEASEWQPGYLDLVPRASLLEWIDHELTSPDTPLDRMAGKWRNLIRAQHLFPQTVRARISIKAFGVRDPQDRWNDFLFAHVDHHGAFADMSFPLFDPRTWRGSVALLPAGDAR